MRLICSCRRTGKSSKLPGKARQSNRGWRRTIGHALTGGSIEGALGTVSTLEQTAWHGNPVGAVIWGRTILHPESGQSLITISLWKRPWSDRNVRQGNHVSAIYKMVVHFGGIA